jgi:hypothetical protein
VPTERTDPHPFALSHCVHRGPRAPSTNFASSCAAQGGLLPLHLAIMQGASEEVVTLLLDANSEATATPDEARTLNL